MPDPNEGVTVDGTIRTGARRDRVPGAFEPVLRDATDAVAGTGASLYVYGSAANGTAVIGRSDVDLLSIDLPGAAALAAELSGRYLAICRGVEVARLTGADLVGEEDEAYGNRVFLRHYCVHLAGPDPAAALPAYAADVRAARGFNGDIAQALERWRSALRDGAGGELGVRVARKTLLAVAGLVSVHDRTWRTDRAYAAGRWSEISPEAGGEMERLLSWVVGTTAPSRQEVAGALDPDGIVAALVDRFRAGIGLWGGR